MLIANVGAGAKQALLKLLQLQICSKLKTDTLLTKVSCSNIYTVLVCTIIALFISQVSMHKRNICVRSLAGIKIIQLNKVKIQCRYKKHWSRSRSTVLGSFGAGA